MSWTIQSSEVLSTVVLLDAPAAGALGTVLLLEGEPFVVVDAASGPVVFLLEDWIGFDGFEFGLEVADGITMGATIGAAATVGKVVSVVLCFFTDMAPITLSSTFLLHLLRVHIDMAGLCKIARKMFLGCCSAIGKSDVIAIVLLMGTCHCS